MTEDEAIAWVGTALSDQKTTALQITGEIFARQLGGEPLETTTSDETTALIRQSIRAAVMLMVTFYPPPPPPEPL